MSDKWLYAKQNLRESIYVLATEAGDVRKRLIVAYTCYLFKLRPEQFPENLKSDWLWVKNELTRHGPHKREDGSIFRTQVEHTCSRIQNKTGVRIAKKILEMYLQLEHI